MATRMKTVSMSALIWTWPLKVCTRNGWEPVKKPINWDSKDMELNTDVISCNPGTVLPCRAVRISTPGARPMWITVR